LARLNPWCHCATGARSASMSVICGFAFIDQIAFKLHKPAIFSALAEHFTKYRA
jgi:hypothetical protein